MSKASEWVKALESAHDRLKTLERDEVPCWYEEPTSLGGNRKPTAYVDQDGRMYLDRSPGEWQPYDAISLARWILATFSEDGT